MIVAVDSSSSTTVMGVGEARADPALRVSAHGDGARRHAEIIDVLFAEHIAPRIADVSTVQAIAVGIGPGPYSGLRVGISFGIGLGRAWGVPVVGVCSLDARAWQVADENPSLDEFTITVDARRRESYWARYENVDGLLRVEGPLVGKPVPMIETFADVVIDAGALAMRVAQFLEQGHTVNPVSSQFVAHGANAASYSLGVGPLFTPTPLYLREPDITRPNSTTSAGDPS